MSELNTPENFRRARAGCLATRNMLVVANMGIVRLVANRWVEKYGGDSDDLAGEGMFALMNAVAKYDPGRNAKFSSYVAIAVHNELCRAVCQNRLIRLPHRHNGPVREETERERHRKIESGSFGDFKGGGGGRAQDCIHSVPEREPYDGRFEDELLLRRERLAVLESLLRRMTPSLRAVFVARYRKGMTCDRYGQQVGASKRQVQRLTEKALLELEGICISVGLRPAFFVKGFADGWGWRNGHAQRGGRKKGTPNKPKAVPAEMAAAES